MNLLLKKYLQKTVIRYVNKIKSLLKVLNLIGVVFLQSKKFGRLI